MKLLQIQWKKIIYFNETGIGDYQLQFIYNRTESSNRENFISITKLKIVGLNEGLLKCSQIKEEVKPNITIENLNSCPLYSKYTHSERSCILNEYIVNKPYQFAIDIKSVHYLLMKDCVANGIPRC